MAVDDGGKTLTLELTRKHDGGDYTLDYGIDSDLSLQLEGMPSGSAVPLPGLDTRASFILPVLAPGPHRIDASLSFMGDTQSTALDFSIGDGESDAHIPCESLTIALATTLYEDSETEIAVHVFPEGCTDSLSWTVSDTAVLSINHDPELTSTACMP